MAKKLTLPIRSMQRFRNGNSRGFSHWGEYVIFALPPGLPNDASTIITLRYSSAAKSWVMAIVLIPTILLAYILDQAPLRRMLTRLVQRPPFSSILNLVDATTLGSTRLRRLLVSVATTLQFALIALFAVGLIGAIGFVGASAYAFATGWALPTTALIRWSSVAEWAARNEPYFPNVLLTLAAFGTLTTWLSRLLGTDIELDQRQFSKHLFWIGLPTAVCAYAFCVSGMWSLLRPGDMHGLNIGGLIPFSDAQAHVSSAYDQARDGTWGPWPLRRPVASAFRSSLLLLSNFSYPSMLLIQATMIGAAAWMASCAVMRWRGVWAGVAFFGLTYIYIRSFVPTTLSEPLGLFFALVAIPFFIDTFRSGSLMSALVGIAFTTVALMIRMGDLFAIPALLLWLTWRFGETITTKIRIGLLAGGIVLSIAGMNLVLERAYGYGGPIATGSNFSYVICGMTMGTGWEGCSTKLKEQGLATLSEREAADRMYVMAWDNFRAHPTVFFTRMGSSIKAFYLELPQVIRKGYPREIKEPFWFFGVLLLPLIAVGVIFEFLRRATPIEKSFWATLCVSLTVSAGILYFDDGSRVLAVSFPFIALLLATGFSTEGPQVEKSPVIEN